MQNVSNWVRYGASAGNVLKVFGAVIKLHEGLLRDLF